MLQQWERIISFMIILWLSFDGSRKKSSVTLILVIDSERFAFNYVLASVTSCREGGMFLWFFFFGLSLSFQLNYLLFFIPPCSLDH